ncbi:MAG: tol-pal system-associated acyl-CoA thioesterase [Gammaproteobacteria bacterium]|nr:tol-pal system-associated acyl-CoA thioesterase [Gammaproteobacteria bacterium]
MTLSVLPVRIYYEDTDAGGVVYYANYLKYIERARTEYLRVLGFEQDMLIENLDIIFAVKKLSIEYKLPARFNDCVEVQSKIKKYGKASLTFEQNIVRAVENGEPEEICRAEVLVACLKASSFKPEPIPKEILEAL